MTMLVASFYPDLVYGYWTVVNVRRFFCSVKLLSLKNVLLKQMA